MTEHDFSRVWVEANALPVHPGQNSVTEATPYALARNTSRRETRRNRPRHLGFGSVWELLVEGGCFGSETERGMVVMA